MSEKLPAGSDLPEVRLPAVGGGETVLGGKREGWQAIFVYRGLHCPICKAYLGKVEAKLAEFAELGAEVVAVSGDPKEKAEAFAKEVGLTMPVGYDLSVAQMRELGLYISSRAAMRRLIGRFRSRPCSSPRRRASCRSLRSPTPPSCGLNSTGWCAA